MAQHAETLYMQSCVLIVELLSFVFVFGSIGINTPLPDPVALLTMQLKLLLFLGFSWLANAAIPLTNDPLHLLQRNRSSSAGFRSAAYFVDWVSTVNSLYLSSLSPFC